MGDEPGCIEIFIKSIIMIFIIFLLVPAMRSESLTIGSIIKESKPNEILIDNTKVWKITNIKLPSRKHITYVLPEGKNTDFSKLKVK